MPIYIEMPKLSDTMTEGTLVKWRKKPGDAVATGDVLAEVETDKATMEMESFDDGILHKLLVEEGAKVALGERLAILLADGEAAPSGDEGEKPKSEPKSAKPAAEDKPAAKTEAPAKPAEKAQPAKAAAPEPAATTSDARVKASPLAKKIAAEKGVPLAGLKGSGPGGRIVAADISAAPAASSSAAAPKITSGAAEAPAAGTERKIPLSGMRRVIAQRLLESKTQIPHFYLDSDINAGPLLQLREQMKQAGEILGLGKVTVNDFVLRAMAIAANRVPRINATFTPDGIIEYGSVHIAVAVAIEDGLITPVIRDAQSKRIPQLSSEMKDLATRARAKKLKPDEYQGGTISLSNLGAYGVESFAAIINPPQAAILSVGTIVKRPVVDEAGEIVVGHTMNLGISGDHRVADGAVAAEFMAELRKLLENPSVLLA